MPEKKYPQSLEAWLEYFLSRKLPSALSRAAQCRKLLSEKAPTYLQLSRLLEADPVIALAIFGKANKAQKSESIFSKTLDHAMSMLGQTNLLEILNNTPKLEEKYGYRAYYQILSASLTKARLAYDFATAKNSPKALDVFWASLFSDAALWYCWCYTTPLMRKIEAVPSVRQHREADQQYQCNFLELQKALLGKLGAPEPAIESLTPELCLTTQDWLILAKFGRYHSLPLGDDEDLGELPPKLKIARQNPLFFIELSSLYFKYFFSPTSVQLPERQKARMRSIACAGLDMEPDDIHRLITKSVLHSARHYKMPYTQSAVCSVFVDQGIANTPTASAAQKQESVTKVVDHKLLAESSREQTASEALKDAPHDQEQYIDSSNMSTKTRRGAVEQITSSSEEETSNSIEIEKTSLENQASIDVFTPSKEFLALLKKMKNAPYQFESATALMQELSIAIQEGLGLQRCAIMLFNKEKSRVKTYFASGIEKSDPLHTFEAQLIKGTIFKVLSDKPAALWVKPSTKREVSDLVPMNFKQVTQRDEQLFASVFSGKQALALIYADTELKTPIREEQFRYFKLATKALETAIVAISSKPKS